MKLATGGDYLLKEMTHVGMPAPQEMQACRPPSGLWSVALGEGLAGVQSSFCPGLRRGAPGAGRALLCRLTRVEHPPLGRVRETRSAPTLHDSSKFAGLTREEGSPPAAGLLLKTPLSSPFLRSSPLSCTFLGLEEEDNC